MAMFEVDLAQVKVGAVVCGVEVNGLAVQGDRRQGSGRLVCTVGAQRSSPVWVGDRQGQVGV